MFETLHVVADLGAPVAGWDDGIHLDGPLSFGAFLDMDYEDRQKLPPISGPWALDFQLPLDTWTCPASPGEGHAQLRIKDTELLWGWRCSAAHADWRGADVRKVRKRVAVAEMARLTDSPSVNMAGGRFKAQEIPYPTRVARQLHWWCVGDGDEILRLLDPVHAIGKLCNQGLGTVLRWHVETAGDDWSIQRDGHLTRRMPLSSGLLGFASVGSIRAPYHHRSRKLPSVEPLFMELRP